MTAPKEEQEARHAEWYAEPKPSTFDIPDEPPELTAQAAAMKAQREYQAQECGQCGRARSSHRLSAAEGDFGDRHGFVETCPNEDDDVLCAIQPDGTFVPEAGCPVHAPDEKD